MSKNDDRILELKKQIDEKKDNITNKKVKFVPETNCVLIFDGINYNLNVCQYEDLKLLLIKLNSYVISAKDLGYDDFVLSGYNVSEWLNDIQNKIEVIELKKEEVMLKSMESKLDKLLSDDKKTELEIDEIAGLLK